MKICHVLFVTLFLCAFTTSIDAQESQTSEVQKAATSAEAKPGRYSTRPAEPPKPPTTPAVPGNISAAPAVQASAACCTKQCPGGGTCGQDCDVVDKLSQCSSNISFECPGNKGLTCVTGTCTCE